MSRTETHLVLRNSTSRKPILYISELCLFIKIRCSTKRVYLKMESANKAKCICVVLNIADRQDQIVVNVIK